MSDDRRTSERPRARPVAGAAVDGVLSQADELAKRWVIALIAARPLEQISELPLEDLARESPALCAHVARALGSDAALGAFAGADREGAGGDGSTVRRLAVLAGARDAAAIVDAVEALRAAVWEALLEELCWPLAGSAPAGPDLSTGRQLSDLADRLAHVCAKLLGAALAGLAVQEPARPAPAVAPAFGRDGQAPPPEGRGAQRSRAFIVDERDPLAPPRSSLGPPPAPMSSPVPAGSHAPASRVRPLPWDSPMPAEMRVQRSEGPSAPTDDSA